MDDILILKFKDEGITMEIDQMRRERHELIVELTVRSERADLQALSVDGIISRGDVNLSSLRARQTQAKYLRERLGMRVVADWDVMMERLSLGVFEQERKGKPMKNIWDAPDKPREFDDFAIDGFALPRRHPAILFGDGGAAKSYFALYLAGRLALQSVKVGYFDWELDDIDHKDRFSRMFGCCSPRPNLYYLHCDQPLARMADHIHREVRRLELQYAFFDSISQAVDGKAEDHETANKLFRAHRQIGIGGMHIAHMTKSWEGSDQKPFGSVFWYNFARSVWFAKSFQPEEYLLWLNLFHRKANCGPLRPPVNFKVQFEGCRTTFERVAAKDVPREEAANGNGKSPTWQRVLAFLKQKRQPVSCTVIAAELHIPPDTVRKAVERKDDLFRIVNGGGTGEVDRVALVEVQL